MRQDTNARGSSITHSEVVEIAYKWVLKNAGCGVAFKELSSSSHSGEIPDVIGFGAWTHSVLIEVKVSRGDFLSDKRKKFRANPDLGMGKHRFYCCPTGLITINDLPKGWGLIYVSETGKAKRVFNPYGGNVNRFGSGFLIRDIKAEHGLMYSALRRLQVRGMVKEIYKPL